MKKFIIILIFILIPFFSGCEKHDINRLDVITAIGIDKTENGFAVIIQALNQYILNPQRSVDIAPVTIKKIEASSVHEAISKSSNHLTKKYYLNHFRILIFGEDVAREGIYKFLNFFLNFYATQHNYNIIVVDAGTAEDLLKIHSSLELIAGIGIYEKIYNSERQYGLGLSTNLDTLLSNIILEGSHFVLSSMKIFGDPEKGSKGDNRQSISPDTYVAVSNLAVFKEDKLIGWLTEKESIGYQYVMNNINKSVVTIVLDDESVITVSITSNKTKIKVNIENDSPLIEIKCQTKGNVLEDMSGMTKFTDEYIEEIQVKTAYEITKMIEDCMIKSQKEFNSDIFQFSERIHRYHPKYWKNIIHNYDSIYPNIDIKVTVNVKLERIR